MTGMTTGVPAMKPSARMATDRIAPKRWPRGSIWRIGRGALDATGMDADLEAGGCREAVGSGWCLTAARVELKFARVGSVRLGEFVLRRSHARAQPTLAGYTRRSWGRRT